MSEPLDLAALRAVAEAAAATSTGRGPLTPEEEVLVELLPPVTVIALLDRLEAARHLLVRADKALEALGGDAGRTKRQRDVAVQALREIAEAHGYHPPDAVPPRRWKSREELCADARDALARVEELGRG